MVLVWPVAAFCRNCKPNRQRLPPKRKRLTPRKVRFLQHRSNIKNPVCGSLALCRIVVVLVLNNHLHTKRRIILVTRIVDCVFRLSSLIAGSDENIRNEADTRIVSNVRRYHWRPRWPSGSDCHRIALAAALPTTVRRNRLFDYKRTEADIRMWV